MYSSAKPSPLFLCFLANLWFLKNLGSIPLVEIPSPQVYCKCFQQGEESVETVTQALDLRTKSCSFHDVLKPCSGIKKRCDGGCVAASFGETKKTKATGGVGCETRGMAVAV
nr:hypothetical protein Iba_chr13bCG13440 [Ipomoea batatas]